MNGLKQFRIMMLLTLSLCWAMPAWAMDSYRYLHVSIDTPWSIFVFLFFMVFAPMVLAVVLYWRYALRKHDSDDDNDA